MWVQMQIIIDNEIGMRLRYYICKFPQWAAGEYGIPEDKGVNTIQPRKDPQPIIAIPRIAGFAFCALEIIGLLELIRPFANIGVGDDALKYYLIKLPSINFFKSTEKS
jgi:hypothetical protein